MSRIVFVLHVCIDLSIKAEALLVQVAILHIEQDAIMRICLAIAMFWGTKSEHPQMQCTSMSKMQKEKMWSRNETMCRGRLWNSTYYRRRLFHHRPRKDFLIGGGHSLKLHIE